jgi:hypothetical protein
MAHDFRRRTLIPRRFPPSIESPGVPYSPLESTPVVEVFWRRDEPLDHVSEKSLRRDKPLQFLEPVENDVQRDRKNNVSSGHDPE